MELCPIYFEGEITAAEVKSMLTAAGLWVVTDPAGRLVARRVPAFLKPDTNVVAMRRRKKA